MYDGKVYKKVEESKYTFVFYKSVHDYIMRVIASVELANVIVPVRREVENLLADPACQMIKAIVVDYNFIEVQPPGCCFDIWNKTFVMDPEGLKGSPRAYVRYWFDVNKDPNPTKFIEG